jgi:hypothetical protein
VAGVVAAILFFAWGRGTGVQGIAQQPNPNVTTKKDVNIAQQPNPNVTMNLSFEEAFLTGRIAWQGVKNTQLTTKSGGQQKVENTEFAMKFKYDPNGKRSIDETGYKTYIWPDREAIFGPGAVIRLSQNLTVREGTIQAGDEWTWTGQQWIASRNLPGFKVRRTWSIIRRTAKNQVQRRRT